MSKIIETGGKNREEEPKSFHLCLEQVCPEQIMNPDKSEESNKDQYGLLKNLRESFSDPSLSQDILRENGCALAEEYTAILQQLFQLAALSDSSQRKLLNADLKIQEQQDELQRKNSRLKQEIAKHIELKKQLQQRTEELTMINSRLTKTINELTRRNTKSRPCNSWGNFCMPVNPRRKPFMF
ncbi:MAG: hypothetical protein D3904_07275 [Candidatus Electrothrix sp. EH2]|nr:hypothetical protein [Candidatus Electrothrix sp. EH2]